MKSTELANVAIGSGDTVGKLYVTSVSTPFGSHLRVIVRPTQRGGMADPLIINISADIVAKS